jgi:bidirectional [NiFe] hydrogenase diaphorase subunit
MDQITQEQSKTRGAEQKSGDNRFKYLDRALARHQYRGDALIEILHTAQELFGYLSHELLTYIAQSLKLPPSKVYGVATFYHFFSLKPKGEHTVTICLGTACYVKGAGDLQLAAEHLCKCHMGETSEGGKVSLQAARCVGSCGIAPVVVYDNDVIGNVDAESMVNRIQPWLEAK